MLHSSAMMRTLIDKIVVSPVLEVDRFRDMPDPGPRSSMFKTMVAALTVSVCLTLLDFVILDGRCQGSVQKWTTEAIAAMESGPLRSHLLSIAPMTRHVVWALGCLVFYFIIPAGIVKLVFREKLSDYGLSPRGFFGHLPVYLILFAPVFLAVVVVSYSESFQATYPFYHFPKNIVELLIWEFFYGIQFFALEFFFRGFMLHSMKYRMGAMSVAVMVIPYCMIHFSKPLPEALAAIIAGSVLGVLALKTRNIWGGVFIHVAVAITMDWASLIQRDALPF